MSEEFNKEFLKLSEKDQKAILNLIQLKNMNKKDEYKKRIDKAIEYIKETPIGSILEVHCGEEEEYTEPLLEILKGDRK